MIDWWRFVRVRPRRLSLYGLLHVLRITRDGTKVLFGRAHLAAGLWPWPTWGRRWPLATSLRGIRCAGLPGSGLRKCLPEQGTTTTMFASLSLLSLLVATSGVSMRWQVIFMASDSIECAEKPLGPSPGITTKHHNKGIADMCQLARMDFMTSQVLGHTEAASKNNDGLPNHFDFVARCQVWWHWLPHDKLSLSTIAHH